MIAYGTLLFTNVLAKIVPDEELDIEYTPYQEYVAIGTHPSIAAYDNHVAGIRPHGNIE